MSHHRRSSSVMGSASAAAVFSWSSILASLLDIRRGSAGRGEAALCPEVRGSDSDRQTWQTHAQSSSVFRILLHVYGADRRIPRALRRSAGPAAPPHDHREHVWAGHGPVQIRFAEGAFFSASCAAPSGLRLHRRPGRRTHAAATHLHHGRTSGDYGPGGFRTCGARVRRASMAKTPRPRPERSIRPGLVWKLKKVEGTAPSRRH